MAEIGHQPVENTGLRGYGDRAGTDRAIGQGAIGREGGEGCFQRHLEGGLRHGLPSQSAEPVLQGIGARIRGRFHTIRSRGVVAQPAGTGCHSGSGWWRWVRRLVGYARFRGR